MIRRLLLILLLAACSPAPKAAEAPPESTAAVAQSPHAAQQPASASAGVAAAFACDDSVNVLALFRSDSAGKAEVALAVNDTRYHLPQLVSADGARYGDSTATFWNKGDAAEFTRAGKKLTCRLVK